MSATPQYLMHIVTWSGCPECCRQSKSVTAMHAGSLQVFRMRDKKSRNLCLQTTLFNYRTSINNEVRWDRHLLQETFNYWRRPTCGDLPSNFLPVWPPTGRSLPVSLTPTQLRSLLSQFDSCWTDPRPTDMFPALSSIPRYSPLS